MNIADIEVKIKNHIANAIVEIETEDNVHYSAVVVADVFAGLSRIKQHQLVLEAIKEEIASEKIHAFSLKTYTNEKWLATKSAKDCKTDCATDCDEGCGCH